MYFYYETPTAYTLDAIHNLIFSLYVHDKAPMLHTYSYTTQLFMLHAPNTEAQALSEAVQDRDTARERVGQAEKMVQEAMSEAERLRRLLGVADGAGDVGVEGASAAVRERDR